MKSKISPPVLVLMLLVLLLLVPLVLGGMYAYRKHLWAEERLAELQPRYARMQGLINRADDLADIESQSQEVLGKYVYPSGQDVSQAGNDAQQRIRNLFTTAGLQIVSSQVLPAKEGKAFDRIPLAIRAESDLIGLQAALAVLSDQKPAIAVNGVTVQTTGAVKPDVAQRLSTQFDLFILRAKP